MKSGRIQINDRWYIVIEKLQYVLWEVKKNDPKNPRTKNETREDPTFFTNLGALLQHIAEYDPRSKQIDSFKDLLQAVKETDDLIKKAVEILRKEDVPFHANRDLWKK